MTDAHNLITDIDNIVGLLEDLGDPPARGSHWRQQLEDWTADAKLAASMVQVLKHSPNTHWVAPMQTSVARLKDTLEEHGSSEEPNAWASREAAMGPFLTSVPWGYLNARMEEPDK